MRILIDGIFRLIYLKRMIEMKICVLDGFTLNPGDLSWSELENLGQVSLFDRTPEDLVLERAKDMEIILTNKTRLTKELLEKLPKVKYIGVLATGYDAVDVQAANHLGIVVTNIPAYGTHSVAQMVFALLLEHCHRTQNHSNAVMTGEWERNPDWCFWNYPLTELANKTMGIVGLGRIGLQVGKIASAFGMNIIGCSRTHREIDLPNFKWVGIGQLMSESDVVSLHCPLTPETEEMINMENISSMKESAIIINTSRGKLVNNSDLAEALNKGLIAGAGLDVLDVEPPTHTNPLLTAKNCIITPHISWATKEARERLLHTAIDNIKSFIDGNPKNHVTN